MEEDPESRVNWLLDLDIQIQNAGVQVPRARGGNRRTEVAKPKLAFWRSKAGLGVKKELKSGF